MFSESRWQFVNINQKYGENQPQNSDKIEVKDDKKKEPVKKEEKAKSAPKDAPIDPQKSKPTDKKRNLSFLTPNIWENTQAPYREISIKQPPGEDYPFLEVSKAAKSQFCFDFKCYSVTYNDGIYYNFDTYNDKLEAEYNALNEVLKSQKNLNYKDKIKEIDKSFQTP